MGKDVERRFRWEEKRIISENMESERKDSEEKRESEKVKG